LVFPRKKFSRKEAPRRGGERLPKEGPSNWRALSGRVFPAEGLLGGAPLSSPFFGQFLTPLGKIFGRWKKNGGGLFLERFLPGLGFPIPSFQRFLQIGGPFDLFVAHFQAAKKEFFFLLGKNFLKKTRGKEWILGRLLNGDI